MRDDERSNDLSGSDLAEAKITISASILLSKLEIRLLLVEFERAKMSKVVYEGWMVRYGRRKIGRSFIHMRYFVLENRLLAYYKRKPQDNQVLNY